MKTTTIIIILLSISFLTFSQNLGKNKITNLNNTNHLNINKISHDSLLEKSKVLMNFKSDSLEKELLYYKVKEDFYTAALSDQANRFTLIITGILALFAIISFGAFKYEVLKIREETDFKLSKHKKEIKKYKKLLTETNNDLKGAKGNLSTSIALHFEKEKNYFSAFYYYLLAAKSHGEHNENIKKTDDADSTEDNIYTTCKTNLNLAMDNLKKITSDRDKESLEEKSTKIKKIMSDVSNLDNDEVKTLIAIIRAKFSEILTK